MTYDEGPPHILPTWKAASCKCAERARERVKHTYAVGAENPEMGQLRSRHGGRMERTERRVVSRKDEPEAEMRGQRATE